MRAIPNFRFRSLSQEHMPKLLTHVEFGYNRVRVEHRIYDRIYISAGSCKVWANTYFRRNRRSRLPSVKLSRTNNQFNHIIEDRI